ncbi:MAG: hypothetical protein AAF927_16095 [Bacteroidota bacterium]
MRNCIIYTVLILLLPLGASAQELQFNMLSFNGIAQNEGSGYFYGGGGLETAYIYPLGEAALHIGAEYRFIDWGNQLSLTLGYRSDYWQQGDWSVSGLSKVQLGAALFNNGSLFAWGLSYQLQGRWQSQGRFFGTLGVGVRYSNAPSYKEFGPIDRLWELPIQLGMGFRLDQKGESP